MHISTAKSRVVWIEKQRFSYNPCGVWLRAAHDPFRRHTNHHHGARRTSALRASPFAAMSCAASVCARSARLSTMLSTGVHRGAIIRGGSPQSPAGLIFARCREVLKLADSCTACPQVSDRPGRRRRRRDHSGLSGRPRFACDRRRTRTRVDATRTLRHAKGSMRTVVRLFRFKLGGWLWFAAGLSGLCLLLRWSMDDARSYGVAYYFGVRLGLPLIFSALALLIFPKRPKARTYFVDGQNLR